MDLEKLRKKLEEAKTLEERRLILEEARAYRDWLRTLLKDLYFALMITVGLGSINIVAICVRTFLTFIYALPMLWIITIELVLKYVRVEKELKQLQEILLDPPMNPLGRSIIYIAIGVVILGIILTVLRLASII
ncbi:MAG: hypothetical protein GXO26_09245 [Crenarchaeota archaeon]|nr:hypothetical protein [Thermoproteota archaeon]